MRMMSDSKKDSKKQKKTMTKRTTNGEEPAHRSHAAPGGGLSSTYGRLTLAAKLMREYVRQDGLFTGLYNLGAEGYHMQVLLLLLLLLLLAATAAATAATAATTTAAATAAATTTTTTTATTAAAAAAAATAAASAAAAAAAAAATATTSNGRAPPTQGALRGSGGSNGGGNSRLAMVREVIARPYSSADAVHEAMPRGLRPHKQPAGVTMADATAVGAATTADTTAKSARKASSTLSNEDVDFVKALGARALNTIPTCRYYTLYSLYTVLYTVLTIYPVGRSKEQLRSADREASEAPIVTSFSWP
jgi:hypothetical protein